MIKIDKEIIENYWKKNVHPFMGDRIAKIILRLSKKYIGKKVLDIGAGSGALIKLIPNAVGIDIIPNKYVQKGDIINLKFKDNSFDTVFSIELLEHLTNKDIKKGLKEVYRVLKPGGYYILTVPFDEDLEKGRFVCPKCNFRFHIWQHLQSFDVERIRRLLKEFGFEIVKIRIIAFKVYEINPRLFFLEALVRKLYKDISKTMFVVARKR